MKFIVCLLTALVFPCLIFAQKKFNVSFIMPDSIEVKKLAFSYYDNQQRTYLPIKASYNNNKATISHSYNTIYAQIRAEYGFEDYRPAISIYTTEKPATVTLTAPIDTTDAFKNATLTNAKSCRADFIAAEEYAKGALDRYQQMHDSLSAKWNPGDSLAYYKLQQAKVAVDGKRLEYICRTPDSYCSFMFFGKYTLTLLPPDQLLQHLNTTFPAKFSHSEEAASMRKHLSNRIVLEGKKKAIPFTAKDINNKQIVLKDIYSKKHVLLVFWGTWCPPCVDEIPLLKEIRKQYPKDQLEIISVASRSSVAKVRQMIKEQQMDWVHIVNNEKIARLYQIRAYPETMLIDPEGNIIYKYLDYPDPGLDGLKQLLEREMSVPDVKVSLQGAGK